MVLADVADDTDLSSANCEPYCCLDETFSLFYAAYNFLATSSWLVYFCFISLLIRFKRYDGDDLLEPS